MVEIQIGSNADRPGERRSTFPWSRLLRILSLPLALLTSGAMVWGGSYAAFSDTAANPNNSWTSGVVALSDDAGGGAGISGTALMKIKNMSPGFEHSRCITVVSDSTVPTRLRMYAFGRYATLADAELFAAVIVTVEEGADSTADGTGVNADPGCGDFVPESTIFRSTLADIPTDYATGLSSGENGYSLAPGGRRSYRFTIELPVTVSNRSLAGKSVIGDFTWETRSY